MQVNSGSSSTRNVSQSEADQAHRDLDRADDLRSSSDEKKASSQQTASNPKSMLKPGSMVQSVTDGKEAKSDKQEADRLEKKAKDTLAQYETGQANTQSHENPF